MQTVRRTANLAPIRARLAVSKGLPAPALDITDALMSPARPATHGEIVSLRPSDKLDDSLEDIWPGLAAEAAARRGAPPVTVVPYRHPQHILDAIAEAEAAAKPSRARKAKDPADTVAKAPRKRKAKDPAEPKPAKEPRTRKARTPKPAVVETPTPVAAPAPVEAPAPAVPPARQPAPRAALGRRQAAPTVLPTDAKRVVEGAAIPGRLVGIVTITGSFHASTGESLVIDVEGQNNVARGLVVWSGPLQPQIRAAAASGQPVRITVRQPSNPRFKPAVSAVEHS